MGVERSPEPGSPPAALNLKQAAAALDVHYMTAYRYVRTGRLPARRVGTGWVVDADELATFAAQTSSVPRGDEDQAADWRIRLQRTLVKGDETAGWRVLEQALAAGHTPADCYLDLVVGAINDISGRSDRSDTPIAQEYLATATAARLVARLGARFRRSGRTKGTVVFGAPLGEYHTLAIAVVADLVRLEGFTCLELGANVPPEAFAGAAADAYRLVAVGIGVTTATNLRAVRSVVDAVRQVDGSVPIVLGGQAAVGPTTIELTGASAWASDGRDAVDLFADLARARRTVWLATEAGASSASRAARSA